MKLVKAGVYKLTETPKRTKILTLNNTHVFAWIPTETIGDLLVASRHPHTASDVLAVGRFKLYDVSEAPDNPRQQLELEVGRGVWQTYALPSGLPHAGKWRSVIRPTTGAGFAVRSAKRWELPVEGPVWRAAELEELAV